MDYWVFRSRPVGHRDHTGGFVFDHEPHDALIGADGLYLVSPEFADQLDDLGYTIPRMEQLTTPTRTDRPERLFVHRRFWVAWCPRRLGSRRCFESARRSSGCRRWL
ncbi:hypothetical protein AB0N05_27655 [Nocardia sp. NPDC051030]|uniref:hypothetical protein n=1 Tax=Nocardia sp. NPDC051030 TaxID=3155162 RepID=UPI0034223CB2